MSKSASIEDIVKSIKTYARRPSWDKGLDENHTERATQQLKAYLMGLLPPYKDLMESYPMNKGWNDYRSTVIRELEGESAASRTSKEVKPNKKGN